MEQCQVIVRRRTLGTHGVEQLLLSGGGAAGVRRSLVQESAERREVRDKHGDRDLVQGRHRDVADGGCRKRDAGSTAEDLLAGNLSPTADRVRT